MKVEPDPLVPDVYLTVRGVVYVRQTRWGPVAQKWPRKRGKPKHAGQLWRQIEFGQIAAATKNVITQDYETACVITKDTNLVPRDVLMLAMMGNLFEVVDETGQVWKGWRFVVSNVQDVLEQLTNVPGAIPARGASLWEWISPGDVGDVLTYTLGGPTWLPATGGGGGSGVTAYGYGTPVQPVWANWSFEPDTLGTPVVTEQPDFGFSFSKLGGTATIHLSLFGTALPAGATWSVIIGHRWTAKPQTNDFYSGLYMRKAGNSRILSNHVAIGATEAKAQCTHWNSPTSFSAHIRDNGFKGGAVPAPIWHRIDKAAGIFTFSFSIDRVNWIPLVTESATAWLGADPDRVGLFMDAISTDAAGKAASSCFDFEVF